VFGNGGESNFWTNPIFLRPLIFIEMPSRIFTRMMQQGLIHVDGCRINIIYQSGLEELAINGKPLGGS
jgi:hypothetical protein